MCWIFQEAFPIWLPIRCPLKKELCMPHEKSSKFDWEPRNGDSGRLGNRSAIFLEKNSQITSQLSLSLGIFRTSVSLSYLQEEEAEKVENVVYSFVFDTPMNVGENVS